MEFFSYLFSFYAYVEQLTNHIVISRLHVLKKTCLKTTQFNLQGNQFFKTKLYLNMVRTFEITKKKDFGNIHEQLKFCFQTKG